MLFNSFEFLVYLPIVFCGYWFLFKKLNIQNLFIIIVSYVFYGWWDWRFLFLIFFTSICCFTSGYLIGNIENKKRKRLICGLNIFINISILGFFKYFNFFADNLKILFQQFGYPLDWFTLDVLLPVGISFYTFQAISYPIDVYRGKIKATNNFVAFLAFISFFPQLVAGPIERSTQLLPQFLHKRFFDYSRAVDGMQQILWGFFKKIVIADNCAVFANFIFDNYKDFNAPLLWLGAFMFTFQIYGDFSGYSDIAIGTARLFGINLTRNFHYPYFSRDIAEFWRRWHISLNTWFRDYIYIPLGGSKVSKIKVIRNIMIIFLLSGLWHGANWTFIVWGAYHGILFMPLILLNLNRKNLSIIAEDSKFPTIKEFFSVVVTFIFVMIGWIIFRSNTIEESFGYIYNCFTDFRPDFNYTLALIPISKVMLMMTFLFIILMLCLEWTQRKKNFGLQYIQKLPTGIRWISYYSLIFIIALFAGEQELFIYFQF